MLDQPLGFIAALAHAGFALDDRGAMQLRERCGAAHDNVRIKSARAAHRQCQIAARDAAAEAHGDDHWLRQRDDDDVAELDPGILRLRRRPAAERLDDLASQ